MSLLRILYRMNQKKTVQSNTCLQVCPYYHLQYPHYKVGAGINTKNKEGKNEINRSKERPKTVRHRTIGVAK
ncbi:hypothetical protein QJS04_geneDACA017126 [Acorus gramineus]|uniref:Uncharacterized protein n=1 Tax=Acorus gramineus TaxID=55184 RepID=A0AAV9AXR2_ACOGR|nr:hypothetical protein QJS04_geneDACA017126 [Acorus gramineus]